METCVASWTTELESPEGEKQGTVFLRFSGDFSTHTDLGTTHMEDAQKVLSASPSKTVVLD